MRYLRGLVCPALLLLVGAGCNRLTPQVDANLVGHLAPRSGPDQAAGLRQGDAVAMAVEEFNVEPKNRVDQRPITVIHADTGSDIDGFGFQATRLLSVNRVAALLGATTTAQLERTVPAVQAGQVVLVSPSGGPVGTPSKLVFCVGVDPRERGRCLAVHAVGEPANVSEVVTVTCTAQPLFAAATDGFTREFTHPVRKVRHAHVYQTRSEFADTVKRLRAASPPAVFFSGPVADLLALRRELKPAPTFFAGEEDEPALRREPELTDGVVYTTAFTAEDRERKSVQEFVNKLQNRPRRQTPEADDALSADAARILFEAARRAGTFKAATLPSAPNIRTELTKPEGFESLTGPLWFTSDQQARRTVYVMQLKQGKPELQKAYAPEKK